MMRQILEVFFIPFDMVTIGSYVASNSGVFSIPFNWVTKGTYDVSNSGVFCIHFYNPIKQSALHFYMSLLICSTQAILIVTQLICSEKRNNAILICFLQFLDGQVIFGHKLLKSSIVELQKRNKPCFANSFLPGIVS